MIGSRGLARTKGKIGWRSLADTAGPALVASGVASRRQNQPMPLDGGRLEANNRNFAIGYSILTQNNVNLKIEPLKCDF